MSDRSFWALVREHVRSFFTNWHEFDASLWTKIGLTIRNRSRALFSREQCCGHTGQPGC